MDKKGEFLAIRIVGKVRTTKLRIGKYFSFSLPALNKGDKLVRVGLKKM